VLRRSRPQQIQGSHQAGERSWYDICCVPIRLTIPHRYDFGADTPVVGEDLLRPEAWDSLRLKTSGPFSIASDRAELERHADERPEIGDRMRVVDGLLRERGAEKIVSYGVGAALPELWLLRIEPERRLVLTDYAPETVHRLRELLPEAEVDRHDLLRDPPLDGDMHMFHRIDTELDNGQWRGVFDRFANQTIVVVATTVLPAGEIPRELIAAFRNRRLTHAGWTRTSSAFESLWGETHRSAKIDFVDLKGWVLDPR
jgi:hypothetical protein